MASLSSGDLGSQAASEGQRFASDILDYFGGSMKAMHHVPRGRLEALQTSALHFRFATLRNKICVLKNMADEQGVEELPGIDDVVPLLFPHTVYTSYPASLLQNGKFNNIAKW